MCHLSLAFSICDFKIKDDALGSERMFRSDWSPSVYITRNIHLLSYEVFVPYCGSIDQNMQYT